MPAINTNNAANAALRYLNNSTSSDAKSIAELASGTRFVQASDDAAGLAISTQLQANAVVFQQDTINIQQGRSLLGTADGGLAQISNVLQRMMALASESASGQVTDTQRRQDIDTEYQMLIKEVNAIASGTQYAGQSLLTYANAQAGFSWNSSSTLTGFYEAQVLRNTQFGANATQVSGDTGTFTDTGQVARYTTGAQGLPTGTTGTFKAGPYEGTTPFGPAQFLTGIGSAGSISVTIGAVNSQSLNLEQDVVTYQDVPPAPTIQVGSASVTIGAYLASHPNSVVAGGVITTVQTTTSNVATRSAAIGAMTTLSVALGRVTSERAAMGAYESRFNFSDSVAQTDLQHIQASVSVVADADIAGVKATLSAQDVQTQAAIAAITQAAQMPTNLLKLIQS